MTYKYNTQEKKMALPEYGRSIQKMVDHCVTIENREERELCAYTIIDIMGNMFPQLRDVPEFNHKLWDHLAMMSDFKLDIDYPVEIIKKEVLDIKPDEVAYPNKSIKYKHYGLSLENLIYKACQLEEGDEKLNLVALICNHMKKSYILWNNHNVDEVKINSDLEELSGGKLSMTPEVMHVMEDRIEQNYHPRQSNNKRNSKKDNRKTR